MTSLPVTYISEVGYNVSWGGDSNPSTDKDLSMPALSGTEANVAIVFGAGGYDWSGVWSFYDSDGIQDTDFTKVFQNVPPGTHGYLQVYVRTGSGSSNYDNKILNVKYTPSCPGFEGTMYAQWWENVNQTPSCDIIMSTASVAGYAPTSVYSAMLGLGIGYSDDEVVSYTSWAGGALIHNTKVESGGSSDDLHYRNGACWQISPSTASSDYLIVASTWTGQSSEYAFEIYAYEIDISSVAGTLSFAGDVDRKISLTRAIAGTLAFTSGVLVTLKLWKATLDAVIRMWLAPQADPIEIDVAPKGFTDIGEDA